MKPRKPITVTIQEASFHRNGVGGLGFYAIRFQWQPEGTKAPENFLATLFDEHGACAVISLDRIATQGIAFAKGNSWRGDQFEPDLRRQIEAEGDKVFMVGSRIGPFALP